MSIFQDVTNEAGVADEKDSLGGGGALNSDVYLATVKMAYATVADSGAKGIVLTLKTEEGREHRETIYVTSGNAKGGKNFYVKDGEKHYLPGYLAATALALLTTGKELSDLEFEEKVVNAYNKDAKAEVPTKVQVATEMLGQQVLMGVIKEKVDKTQKNEATGNYDPTGETREQAVIDKFFHAETKMTVPEIRAKAEEPVFHDNWIEKWKGQTRDKTSKTAGTPGVPKTGFAGVAANQPTKKPATSLFAKQAA